MSSESFMTAVCAERSLQRRLPLKSLSFSMHNSDRRVMAAHIASSTQEDGMYVFTTMRWQHDLVMSDDNTRASGGRPSPFYLMRYHVARLVRAYAASFDDRNPSLESDVAAGLDAAVVERSQERALRIKARVYADGKVEVEAWPVSALPAHVLFPEDLITPTLICKLSPSWSVVLDHTPTALGSHTAHKTSDRACYDRARTSAEIQSLADTTEVLLYNTSDEIMDASISTPYFHRNGVWTTPAASCGGQLGVTRQWAIDQGLCVEGVIDRATLVHGEFVWLSNALRGFFIARYPDPRTIREAPNRG